MKNSGNSYPPFSLIRLLSTVFAPKGGERVALLIDLPDPGQMRDFMFLQDPALTIQRHAHDVFYQGLKAGVLAKLGMTGGEMFAYKVTGGSNLDLPATAMDSTGQEVLVETDIWPNYDIILCISTYSATAPLTALAKRFGFRGATLHGLNDTILATGLSVDYDEVSQAAEKLRLGVTGADFFELDFEFAGRKETLKLACGGQEAQKSHGLCRGEEPDVANLPAGEVYFVPSGAEGRFPMKYEDGTIGVMEVRGGRIERATLVQGDQAVVDLHNERLKSDPMTGELGELGFGTQELPPSGSDIQDEKILGTVHVATGRSDHLGGHLTPDKFAAAKNATHDDILFSPTKTPEITVTEVRMFRGDQTEVVIENFKPSPYFKGLLTA